MIDNYNWTLKLSNLCEDGIISDILREGFSCNGIEKFSDLKGDKTGLPSFLKDQAIYLEQFLNVIISCNYRKYTSGDLINALPQNIKKTFDAIWNSLGVEERMSLCEYFGSPEELLLSLFTEKEQVFGVLNGLSAYDYEYKNKLLSIIVNSLMLYCDCFSDCIYFGRFFNIIIPKDYTHTKDNDKSINNILKEHRTIVNNTHIWEDTFSSLMQNLSVRSKNVLINNGIDKLDCFLSWMRSFPNFNFLDFKNCGKKSAIELEDFRAKVKQVTLKRTVDTDLSLPKPAGENDDKIVDYLVKCLNISLSNDATSWMTENFGSLERFSKDFVSSPQSLFKRLCEHGRPSSYKLCVYFCEIFAKTALSSDDTDIRDGIQALLSIFVQQIDNNRQNLIERMLLTDDKKSLIRIEFNKAVKGLSTRAINVLSNLVDANDSNNIVAFVDKHHDFLSMDKIGRRSSSELYLFHDNLFKHLAQILFSDEDDAEFYFIHAEYPFLEDKEVRFVSSFYSEFGHYPMFFLAARFFIQSKHPWVSMFKDYYGIGMDSSKNLEEIASKSNYTRERVRQIISSFYKWAKAGLSLFAIEKWKDYPFICDTIITKESSNFLHVVASEHIKLTFSAFCRIASLVDDKIIKTFRSADGSMVCVAYSHLIKGFSFAKAIKEFKRISALNRDVDIVIPLYDFFASNEIYWSCCEGSALNKVQIDLAYNALLVIVRELHIGEIDDNGNIVFKANKLNYSDIIYNFISSKGSPMRMEEIRKEFDRKYPNDSHNTEATIRSYIQRDDRIESIGRTSIYKLTSWGGFSGSIPELLTRLLAIKGRPVQSKELAKEALRYRPDSTRRSIISNINQKVNEGELCMFYPDLVGLTDKNYGQNYKILPRTFDDNIKAFVNFVKDNKRFPYASSIGYEGMLYHWYNKTKKLVSLSDSEILAFSKVMKELENSHFPHNSTESCFLSMCKRYKDFVSTNHRLVSDEDSESIFSWFKKSARNYLDWNDNRKYYFQDLMNYIRASVPD